MHKEDLLIPAVIALFIALVACLIIENNDWVKFKAEHDCKVVAHINDSLMTTVGPNGKVGIGITGEKTGWLCNDGVTYYR